MRILMLSQFYPPMIGGEERHVRDLAAALVKRGHDVNVATMWQDDQPATTLDQGVKVHRLHGMIERCASRLFSETGRPHAPPLPDPELTWHLHQLIAQTKPDVVHAHNWMLHSFLPLKRSHGPRLLVTLHDLSLVCGTKTGMYGDAACTGRGVRKCLGCAAKHYGAPKGSVTLAANWMSSVIERRLVDMFLAVSNAIAAGSGLPTGPTPYEVVPNFVRDDIAQLVPDADPRLEQLPKEPYILFVGDLRRMKGIDVLLDAYRLLKRAPPLVVIGRPRQEAPPDWPANVHTFEGWPNTAVMHAWSRCLIGVVPTVGPEACATVVLEAMSLGKPVAASRVGGMPDLITHCEDGLLSAAGDPVALAANIQRLLDDPELRTRLSAAGLRKVEAFKAASVIPRIETAYRTLIGERTKPSESTPNPITTCLQS